MRVLIAPHDIAGQMGILARSLRDLDVDAWSVELEERDTHLHFDLDERLGIDPRSASSARLVQRARFAVGALRRYDVFHYFFGRTLVPGGLDVTVARGLGRTVVVHFRGRDVTTVNKVIAESSADGRVGPRNSPAQRDTVAWWRRHAARLLISTPDLWREVPDAVLVPQAIELERWPFEGLRATDGRLVVGHAPTNRGMKGTAHVARAVEKLRSRGHDVVLELIEGVPPAEVIGRMRRCDVAVDQVVQGAYGNVTIQFMALGRPTVNLLDGMYSQRGINVPTVSTTPSRLADDLDVLVSSRETMAQLSLAGRRFVEERHDARVVASSLLHLYQDAAGARK